jgi:hypothetical protein
MRRQEKQEQLKDKELEKELMIKKFAEDFGLQLQGLKQYLERRGLQPMRRSDIMMTPESTSVRGVTRTVDKRGSKRRQTIFRTPPSYSIGDDDETEEQDDLDVAFSTANTMAGIGAGDPVRDLRDTFEEAEEVARDAKEKGVPSTRLTRAAELGSNVMGMAGQALKTSASVAAGVGSSALGVAGSAASTTGSMV